MGIVADDPEKLCRGRVGTESRFPPRCGRTHATSLFSTTSGRWRGPIDEKFGAPDVLVNNAGYAVYYTFEQMPLEEIQRLFQVNLVGAALVTREFLPDMIRAGGGDVVMVASIAGRIPMTPCGVYSASKHGLVALAELLKIEDRALQLTCSGGLSGTRRNRLLFPRVVPEARPSAGGSPTITAGSRVASIVDAVEHDRFMTYVPDTTAILAWLAAGLPLVFRPLWHRLMAARVESRVSRCGSPKPE